MKIKCQAHVLNQYLYEKQSSIDKRYKNRLNDFSKG